MSDLEDAAELYQSFREEKPRRARKLKVAIPEAVAVMGHCEFVGYVTTHRGKTALYMHEFAPGSRPVLAAGKGRGQLYLIGGRFTVTGRGIVDVDRNGRPTRAKRRYEVKLRNP